MWQNNARIVHILLLHQLGQQTHSYGSKIIHRLCDRRQLRTDHRSHPDIIHTDNREIIRHFISFVLDAMNGANRHLIGCCKDRRRLLLQSKEILHRFDTGLIPVVADSHQIFLILDTRSLQRLLVPWNRA